jgi:hypothetical protein
MAIAGVLAASAVRKRQKLVMVILFFSVNLCKTLALTMHGGGSGNPSPFMLSRCFDGSM